MCQTKRWRNLLRECCTCNKSRTSGQDWHARIDMVGPDFRCSALPIDGSRMMKPYSAFVIHAHIKASSQAEVEMAAE